jgi:DNA-binding MarR family transcriptional regulator
MNRASSKRRGGDEAGYVSRHLLLHIGLLTRLLTTEVHAGLTRTEAALLRSVGDGPRRITELAELEGLAQPTTTQLVKRLEGQGLVRRERQADDERVVLVWQTDAGAAALEEYLTLATAVLRGHLDAMPDDQLQALTAATDALGDLIATLLSDAGRRGATA